MAIDNFQRTVWSARLTDSVFQRSVYAQLANRNWEADTPGARTVRIGQVGAIAVSDYAKNTDITVEDLDDTTQDLVMDQQKYFAFAMDDVDRAQTSAPIMEAAVRNAGRQIAIVQDTFLRDLFDDAEAGNTHSETTAAGSITDGYAGALGEMKEIIYDDNHVPGALPLNIVVPPEVAKVMEANLEARASNFGDVVAAGGFAGQRLGFNVFVSTNVNKASSAYQCPVTVGDVPVTLANQIASIEAGRQERRFADYVKGLYVYGAKVVQPDHLYKLSLAE